MFQYCCYIDLLFFFKVNRRINIYSRTVRCGLKKQSFSGRSGLQFGEFPNQRLLRAGMPRRAEGRNRHSVQEPVRAPAHADQASSSHSAS